MGGGLIPVATGPAEPGDAARIDFLFTAKRHAGTAKAAAAHHLAWEVGLDRSARRPGTRGFPYCLGGGLGCD